jgi:hypothetical protein
MEAKVARLGKDAPNPFVDPQGYRAYISDREKVFEATLAQQRRERP